MKRLKLTSANSSAPKSRRRPLPRPASSHPSVIGFAAFAKRAIDVTVAAAALIVLAPLLAAIAGIIKMTDGGPVFYRQVRLSLNRRQFTIIKFRTMIIDAEKDLGAIWSVPHDPRGTRPGAWLRRLGLDELPQLWNVLRGDMSLVGPRPERPNFVAEFQTELPLYDLRHNVRAGLTGYAQIHGWRGYTSVEQRLRHDLYYMRNWSLWLDLRILALTLVYGWSERRRDGVSRALSGV